MRIAWDNIRENTLNVNILCKCELILLTFWQCSVQFHKDLLDGRHCMSKLDILVSNYSLCSIKYKNECFKKKKNKVLEVQRQRRNVLFGRVKMLC